MARIQSDLGRIQLGLGRIQSDRGRIQLGLRVKFESGRWTRPIVVKNPMEVVKRVNRGIEKIRRGVLCRVNANIGGMETGSMVALKRVNGALVRVSGGIGQGEWGIEKGQWGLVRVNGGIGQGQWGY